MKAYKLAYKEAVCFGRMENSTHHLIFPRRKRGKVKKEMQRRLKNGIVWRIRQRRQENKREGRKDKKGRGRRGSKCVWGR